ncbi:serine/threonine-protein kinase [Nocardioides limicola]|uniref:serine/threonine-protein kinase n=1 Tax=Nocardioides limicola TaxID=2803368 RepID=UPI00193B1DAF|nr:serine/threonine-protein kinase [Nocardioides sp. DJM-14]
MSQPPLIEGFTFVDRLGGGGFAEVFRYEQAWPRQQVAVKVVRPDVPLTEREKELFTSEANAMARVGGHPNIVPVLSAGLTADGRPYLVMPYCPPPDLGARVRQQPMSVPEALRAGIKLASAIETAHRAGILHRDIKPGNVLVTSYSEPALTDFGIAGQATGGDTDQEIRISFPWAPPEMVDGTSNGSPASDVYSLGATIWNCLVGRSPFAIPSGDNSTRGLTARILHAAPPATMRPDVPPELDRLLQQCLAKRPEHRPTSAMELARGLQRIEAAAGLPKTPITVEGDHQLAGAPAADGDDATAVKMPSLPGQQPTNPATRAAGDSASTAPRRLAPLVWTLVGVLVLGAAVSGLAWRAASGRDEPSDPGPPLTIETSEASPTQDVAPGAPTRQPELTGDRDADRVTFRWRSTEGDTDGDEWRWEREDTGEGDRIDRRRLVIESPDRVCVRVQLIRGRFASPWARRCVD